MSRILDYKKYQEAARKLAAEGCVLLENKNETLPLRAGDRVAVFGRIQNYYYKSGLGSGGLVYTAYVRSVLDALKDEEKISLNKELLKIYEDFEKESPVKKGEGWGKVPFYQKEKAIDDRMLAIAQESDVCLVIIGRCCGEDQDFPEGPGGFLLTEEEITLIEEVSKSCKRTAVLLNTGSVIDMSWVKRTAPGAVMYIWQGGQEGGNGVCDVLMGRVSPSGRLCETIADDIKAYPAYENFGDPHRNIYKEDIFVGYRYFETFAQKRVLYPFGYGLSYTEFKIEQQNFSLFKDLLKFTVKVTNTGKKAGKEAVLIFISSPEGKVKKSRAVLAGFVKTEELKPGESCCHTAKINFKDFAYYDEDSQSLRLDAGDYRLYAGENVRDEAAAFEFSLPETELERLPFAALPVEGFETLDGRKVHFSRENKAQLPAEEYEYDENCRCSLFKVYRGEKSIAEFVKGLTDQELIYLFRGEGMCSPKVTPGTASAFGGLVESLKELDMPACCCSDGPSGIRMDCGTIAFSLPSGSCIACSFNEKLTLRLFEFLGLELALNHIDAILGPGVNIRRHPLCGRNFEYFSEDPFLSGKMCVAELTGLQHAGVFGTIKHFAANNQEYSRNYCDSIISQRALREIYLKPFEMAARSKMTKPIMSSYNPLNGKWTASNPGLLTQILREQWGYRGIVMTDWWSMGNTDYEEGSRNNRLPMVLSQNDIYMVCSDAKKEEDGLEEALSRGQLSRKILARNAVNIIDLILSTNAMRILAGDFEEVELINGPEAMEKNELIAECSTCSLNKESGVISCDNLPLVSDKGKGLLYFIADADERVDYDVELVISSEHSRLAQLPIAVYYDNIYRHTYSFTGSEGERSVQTFRLARLQGKTHYLKLYFTADGIKIEELRMIPVS